MDCLHWLLRWVAMKTNQTDTAVGRRDLLFPPPSATCMNWPYQMVTELTTSPQLGTASLRHWSATITQQLQQQLHPHVHLQSECAIPAFAFPALANTHLLTPEGWKPELAWLAGYMVRQFICLKAVTHPTTNRAPCSTTALIETTTPNCQQLPRQYGSMVGSSG